ncbi:LOW QUALITY PROTEIN: uncharacterized protein At4g18490 [Morus notabilis]|uniref:LOW QUALITY PROTEIN: uncharacterized protein At4g18490 n=1 Tax=Morus notabilis TaxID=981085 RepID=UPI000CED076D|nr:LOW QUALITY PROTEIN: uncharacterized protein At4g18490 [Morus notabilis]
MEEPQKGTSSANAKETKSFLDEDIGKDFLSSWKSMSVADDDAMDFSFNTVSSGKNKFNFEKLNMDFNLDGDFDKLSSFKVDMSDFDLSAPSKKATRLKERLEDESSTENRYTTGGVTRTFKVDMSDFDLSAPSKKATKLKERPEDESSTGNRQGFNFSFDFNELDSFNFESSLAKEEKASSKKQDDTEKISSDGSGTEGPGSKLQLDDIAMKLPTSEDVTTPNSEALLCGPGNLKSTKKDQAMDVSSGDSILLNSARSSPEKAMSNSTEAIDQQIHLSEKAISKERYSQHAVLNFPGQSFNGVDSNRDTLKDEKTESCQRGNGVHITSSRREDVNDKMMDGVSSYHEDLPSKNSSPPSISNSGKNKGWMNKSGSDVSTVNVDGNESAEGDLDLEENSISSISRKALHEIKSSKENCTSRAELPEANLCREGFSSDRLPNGSKLVGKSHLYGEEATRRLPVIPASDKKIKDQNTLDLQVSPSSASEKQGKLTTQTCANSKPFVPSMESVQNSRVKPIEGNKLLLVRAGKKMPDLATMKISKTTVEAYKVSSDSTQKESGFPRNTEQNVEVDGSTASETSHPFKSNEKKSLMNLSLKRKTFELSNSDLSCQKPLKRLSESLPKIRDLKEPLKRVAEEKFSTAGKSLKTLKFPPEGVSENRDIKEPLKRIDVKESFKRIDVKESFKRIGVEKVCIDKNHVESKTKSIIYNVPASAIDSPQQVNMMEFEISSVMENDGNVEKAEAYAKELEDICNMLKKKHEEAKEILVRAIVNNNNLLMLNHPISEEKIYKVQKFAADLMSKEIKV